MKWNLSQECAYFASYQRQLLELLWPVMLCAIFIVISVKDILFHPNVLEHEKCLPDTCEVDQVDYLILGIVVVAMVLTLLALVITKKVNQHLIHILLAIFNIFTFGFYLQWLLWRFQLDLQPLVYSTTVIVVSIGAAVLLIVERVPNIAKTITISLMLGLISLWLLKRFPFIILSGYSVIAPIYDVLSVRCGLTKKVIGPSVNYNASNEVVIQIEHSCAENSVNPTDTCLKECSQRLGMGDTFHFGLLITLVSALDSWSVLVACCVGLFLGFYFMFLCFGRHYDMIPALLAMYFGIVFAAIAMFAPPLAESLLALC